jgi:DNA-binding winged helix-turn-helix (wHTH) protein
MRRRGKIAGNSCSVTVRLQMNVAASERLIAAARDGPTNFILMSANGRVSVRARLFIEGVEKTEHRSAERTVVVDWSRASVSNGESTITLARTQLRLLAALLDGDGAVVSRSALIGQVWPGSELTVADRENALGVYICALRKRMTAIGLGHTLETVRRSGYRLVL